MEVIVEWGGAITRLVNLGNNVATTDHRQLPSAGTSAAPSLGPVLFAPRNGLSHPQLALALAPVQLVHSGTWFAVHYPIP